MHIISFSSKDALLSNHWECIVLFRVIHINACCTSSLPKHEMKVGTHKIYFTLRIIVIRLNNKLVLGFRRQLFISFFAFEKVAVQYILRPCNRKTSCTYFQPFHKWGGQNFLPSIIHLLPLFPGYTIFSYMFSLLSLFASKNAHKHSWCYDISTILLVQSRQHQSFHLKPNPPFLITYFGILIYT